MADHSGNFNRNGQDFIPFSSPPQTRFNPCNYSSPVKNNYRGKHNNHSFNSSHTQNNSSNRYSRSYNRSYNNSRNNSWSKNNSNNSKVNDISSFLHPSFMEDPWKKLEEDHVKKSSG